jgi:putative restriction endonuclease
MSVRNTLVLSRSELKFVLIDSLKLYSDNVEFIGGNNPYRFSLNKRTFFSLIKNVHESGENRLNEDECRIQVSKTSNFNPALNSDATVLVLGYFADENIFTAWNPYRMKDRFNQRQTISLYSRFSVQRDANIFGISCYTDNNSQNIISFKPKYLGLYLDNISNIHLLSKSELLDLINKSDELEIDNTDGQVDINGNHLIVSHSRTKRDPKFQKLIYSAYKNRCAMCGISLELVEAAHIIPHSHEKGTDDANNGICLCALHHTAYDKALIYFDEEYKIHFNLEKIKYLEKIGLEAGYRKISELTFPEILMPETHFLKPDPETIKMANRIRGISS